MSAKTIVLVSPHGFCAGVERAVDTANALLSQYPAPVYCLHEIVHNPQIVADLTARGMVFVRQLEDIPPGAVALFSAHGIPPSLRERAAERGLKAVDATCPFVTKVHNEVKRYADAGYTVLLVGHRAHVEVVGVAGEAPDRVTVIETEADARAVAVPDPDRVAVMSQTTLSPDDTGRVLAILRERFPALKSPADGDICYATRNRQQAVRRFAREAGFFIVIGARNSSNSNRLVEVARAEGCRAALVSTPAEVDTLALEAVTTLGLTAGASTPEYVVAETIERLKRRGFERVQTLSVAEEDLHFSLPAEVRPATRANALRKPPQAS